MQLSNFACRFRAFALLTSLLLLSRPLASQREGGEKIPAPVSPRQYENESEFLVALDAKGVAYVRDGKTGRVRFTSADAGEVVNYAISALGVDGGQIFLKAGNYSVGTRIDIVGLDRITIMGGDGAVLMPSTSTAVVLVDGDSSDVTLQGLTIDGAGIGTVGVNLKTGSNIRIRDCVFRNLSGAGIQGHIHSDYSTLLSNLWITGCVVSYTQQSNTTQNAGGIFLYCGQNVFIQNNVVEFSGSTGMTLSRCTGRAVIANNIVRNNDVNSVAAHGHGIYVGSNQPQSSHVLIRGNTVTGNGGNGIEAGSGGGAKGTLYVIAENVCTGNGATGSGATNNGIFVTGSRHQVVNNICENNGGSGIKLGYSDDANRIVIEGNTIGNNNVAGNTNALWSSGIACTGPAVQTPTDQLILIQGNLIYEDDLDPAGGNQLWGIHLNAGADGIVISHNRVVGHPNLGIEWDPGSSSVLVESNPGFRTEAEGQIVDSAPSGTSGYLTVDLASDLDVDDVIGSLDPMGFHVTPIVGPSGVFYSGASFHYWVEQFSSTEFRIHWVSGTVPSELAFSWTYDPR